MRTISIIRGRNKKSSFWVPAILYPILMILLLVFGMTSPADSSVTVIYYVVLISITAFGVLAPLLNLGIKWSFPDVFSKFAAKQKNANQRYSDPVDREILIQEQPRTSTVREKSPEVEASLYYPFDTVSATPNAGVISGHIFISYRRSDSADIAGRIYDRLVDKFGKDPIFKDVDSIPLGYDFKEYIEKMVGESSVMLAIIGDRWLDASDSSGRRRLDNPLDIVRVEIESALGRGIPVIPLLVRSAEMPREGNLPPSLRKLIYRNGIPIRSDPDFHRDMDRLISGLEKYLRK